MTNNILSDGDIEELMGDEEGRKALVDVLKKLNHIAYCVAHNDHTHFPYYERLRNSVKVAEPHLERISEEKRKKREEERAKK